MFVQIKHFKIADFNSEELELTLMKNTWKFPGKIL